MACLYVSSGGGVETCVDIPRGFGEFAGQSF